MPNVHWKKLDNNLHNTWSMISAMIMIMIMTVAVKHLLQ